MAIYLGSNEIENLYLGSGEIENVYLGSNEVWANAIAFDLGTHTSFDLSGVSGYQNFTANNFYIVDSTTYYDDYDIGEGGSGSITMTIVKSYDSSTGTLTAYYRSSYSGNIACRVYLVKKPSKLSSLGTATSFNIQTLLPDVDYTQLTKDDFVVSTLPTQTGTKTCYSSSCDVGAGYTKTYNSSTGVLTFYTRGTWASNQSVTPYYVAKIKQI